MVNDKCWKCGDGVERTNTTLPGCDNDIFHDGQPPAMPVDSDSDEDAMDALLNKAIELETGRIEATEAIEAMGPSPLSESNPVRELDADGYAMFTHEEIIAMGSIIAIKAANEFASKTMPLLVEAIKILKTAAEKVVNSLGPDKVGCSHNECKGCICEMEYALEEAKSALVKVNEIAKESHREPS